MKVTFCQLVSYELFSYSCNLWVHLSGKKVSEKGVKKMNIK